MAQIHCILKSDIRLPIYRDLDCTDFSAPVFHKGIHNGEDHKLRRHLVLLREKSLVKIYIADPIFYRNSEQDRVCRQCRLTRLALRPLQKLLQDQLLQRGIAVVPHIDRLFLQPAPVRRGKTQCQLCLLVGVKSRADILHKIIRPIFNAAGITFNPQKVFILNDNSLNAFVSDGNYLFIHTGTLINADNVNELNGIIAHETGHIAGGHIVRQKLQINRMQSLAVASLIAAGAAAAASGNGDAAMAVLLGSQSSLLNSMTAYQMQEERSADESAVKYLKKIGQSPRGLKNFMKGMSNYSMNYKYDVSVLIVNYNGKKYIENLFESLCRLNHEGFTYEVIFEDNNSSDG